MAIYKTIRFFPLMNYVAINVIYDFSGRPTIAKSVLHKC